VSVAYPLDGAVCEGVATADYDPFFPESREAEADALAMCSICPVRGACLAFAVDTGQMFGIWGGKTQREVRSLVARARAGRARAGRVSRGHAHADKTHCAYGHPFDAANTYYTPTGERRCRACRARIARARRRAGRVTGGER
jgi:WhiB family redox-sensing transcriptional regulator